MLPSQIAYRCMTNYRYASERYAMNCPTAMRLLKPNGDYRKVDEMANDDLTNMLYLISDPTWMWRNPKGKSKRSPKQKKNESEEDEDSSDEEDEGDEGDDRPNTPTPEKKSPASDGSTNPKFPKGKK